MPKQQPPSIGFVAFSPTTLAPMMRSALAGCSTNTGSQHRTSFSKQKLHMSNFNFMQSASSEIPRAQSSNGRRTRFGSVRPCPKLIKFFNHLTFMYLLICPRNARCSSKASARERRGSWRRCRRSGSRSFHRTQVACAKCISTMKTLKKILEKLNGMRTWRRRCSIVIFGKLDEEMITKLFHKLQNKPAGP